MSSSSVSEPITSPVTSLPSLTTGPRCVARFDYDGGEPDDLVFMSSDTIRLVDRVNDEWYRGELNGRTGIFPLAFVEIIEDLPPPTDHSGLAHFLTSEHVCCDENCNICVCCNEHSCSDSHIFDFISI